MSNSGPTSDSQSISNITYKITVTDKIKKSERRLEDTLREFDERYGNMFENALTFEN